MKKVMVFGVFDGLHEGHDAFLRQAKALGDYLIAAVAHDHIVEKLKDRLPERSLQERLEMLEQHEAVDQAVPGDDVLGRWLVIAEHAPHVIALGYDQQAQEEDLKKYRETSGQDLIIIVLNPHKPDLYHSSLLNGKRVN